MYECDDSWRIRDALRNFFFETPDTQPSDSRHLIGLGRRVSMIEIHHVKRVDALAVRARFPCFVISKKIIAPSRASVDTAEALEC